jgi:hypothetical protein
VNHLPRINPGWLLIPPPPADFSDGPTFETPFAATSQTLGVQLGNREQFLTERTSASEHDFTERTSGRPP